ncbi:hypothetical protein KY308_00505 [Candidatus Woesearchaeota archaeon]|nr:hypothetical protein [Candidatus Woesearchaeota archaeon]
MADELNDSKNAGDFLSEEQQKSDKLEVSGIHPEKKIKQKIKEEKNEVNSIQKERKKLTKVRKAIKKEKNDEELSIDFGKIKNFFKPRKNANRESGHAHGDKEEFSLDARSVKDFFVKYGVIILILIPLVLSISIRMEAASLSFTDGWAKSTVENYYKTQIRNQVDQQYPNLPDKNKAVLVDQQFASYKESNKDQINAQIKDISQRYKEYFRFDDGRNYMPDIDPYVYLRYAENYLNHGYIGDEKRIVNGTEVQWDNHQVAPLGVKVEPKTLHPYFLVYLYKIVRIFNPVTTPMQSSSYFPVILSALSVIPVFFIGKKLGGNVGGFFAALIFALSTTFLGRTLFGHADTDAYNIFFPLFIVWIFLEAFEQKDKIKQMIYAGGAGIILGIYSSAWDGWWYVFDFILGMLAVYMLYLLIFDKKALIENLKKLGYAALSFIIVSGIFVSLFNAAGFPTFIRAPLQPLAFTTLKVAAHETLWPNVYTTVAELNSASLSQVVASVGGNLMFIISLVGIAFLFFSRKQGKKDIPFAILVVLWYIGIFYASTKGIRFTMMLAPPFAITFGIALGRIHEKGVNFAVKDLHLGKAVAGSIIIILFLLLFITPLKSATSTANSDIPIINDAWYNSLISIKYGSAENAIINSWWDFGHHFKYYADRAVTFDGGTQNSPMAHWIGKTLLTDDEDLAVGILRMLDCGSNNAFETLNKKINDTSISVNLLYDLVKLSRQDAKKLLQQNGLSDSESEKVLSDTHCQPPEDYFITSEDMVGKSGVWAHFGSWDFDRADIWVFAKKMPHDSAIEFIMKNSNVSIEEAERLYFEAQGISDEAEANSWIAPWPSYAGQSNCINIQNKTVSCENGVKINLTTMNVEVPTQQGIMPPYSLVYATKEGIVEKKFDSKFAYSIAFINKENPIIVIMQPELAMSTFTKLFYFEGYGLDNFKLFDHQTGLTGTNVYVWKVKWPDQ